MKFPLVWTNHLPDQEKPAFEAMVRNSTLLLSRLNEILSDEEKTVYRSLTKDFDSPNWSHEHAFRLGELSRIRKLKDLISFIEKE